MPPRTDTRLGTDIQIRTGITGITTGITAIERQIAERKIDWHSTPMPMEKAGFCRGSSSVMIRRLEPLPARLPTYC
jgi:hypothetical protein